MLAFLGLSVSVGLAEDAYYYVPLTSLKFAEGKLPTNYQWSGTGWQAIEALQSSAVLDGGGDGEAFVGGENLRPWGAPESAFQNTFLAVRAPRGKAVNGRLFVPKADLSGMVALKFHLEAAAEKPAQEFFKAKENYYHSLRERN